MHRPAALIGSLAALALTPAALAQFDFIDVTGTNLVLGDIASDDTLEKDFETGDFDNDGDDDVIVVRKRRFSNPGPRTDFLLMNVNGTLINQTAMYAPDMVTRETDARDVRTVDLDNDGWLDLVLASTFSDTPTVYMNLGDDGAGGWLGFDEQSSRIPALSTLGPLQFCAVWSGDLTGNGFPDLYFINYNPAGPTTDILVINDGTGNFTEETSARLDGPFGNYARSAFGTDVEFHDMDNDGDLDICKLTTLFDVSPFNDRGVFILYNNGSGFFNTRPFQEISNRSDPYMFEGCDFNNDGMMDLYVATDTQDSWRMATALTPDGPNTYGPLQNTTTGALNGFGGNVHCADLDNDGDQDLMVSPIDTDIQNCEAGGRVVLMQNMGLASGNLQNADPSGVELWSTEAFDFQFFDLNGDNRVDVLFGDCTGYTLLVQEVDLCQGDCDVSGTVDFNDLVCALFEFGGANLAADCDASGTVDFNDLVCMLFVFGPCP